MYLLDIHVEISRLELSREDGVLYKTPLWAISGVQTHLTQDPLHICFASVAGSVWAPANFL